MGAERSGEQTHREIQASGGLVQRFTYQTVEEIPPGVNPQQWDFLREAANIGAFTQINLLTAILITEYFTTEETYDDLAQQYGVTGEAVRKRIAKGMEKLSTILHQKKSTLQDESTYPLGEILKGKDLITVSQSERSRERRRVAHTPQKKI